MTLNQEEQFFKFKSNLAPVNYLFKDNSITLPESLPTTTFPQGEEIETHTDLFASKNYSGNYKGSSRHCFYKNLMIKGIGATPLAEGNDLKHKDGKLSFEEMIQEFAIYQVIQDHQITPRILGIGEYKHNNHYFIIREHIYPRLAQFDQGTAKSLQLKNSSPAEIIITNLLTPFKLGLHHLSLNSANINILGQYLDLASFGLIEGNNQKIFINQNGENTLSVVKRLTEEALLVWGSILNQDLALIESKNHISTILSDAFGEENLKLTNNLFWGKMQSEVEILIPEKNLIQPLVKNSLNRWKHILTNE